MASLKKGIIGSFLLFFQSFADKAIGMLSTLFLARLLTPDDFGIVAIATLILSFLESFAVTGSEQYLTIKNKISADDINTGWTINFILKMLIALTLIIIIPFASDYYHEPRLKIILWFVVLNVFISVLHNPGLVLFSREQEYAPRVKIIIAAKIISAIFTVVCAFIFKSYLVLVLGQTVSALIRVIGSYMIHPFRPKFNLSNYKQQLNFSGWLIPQSLLGYGKTQADTLFIASRFGSEALGGYHIVKYLALIVNSHIINPILEPALRQLASIQDNKTYFATQSNVCFIVSLLITTPFCLIMVNNHSELTALFLGEQWLEYSPVLGVCAISVLSLTLNSQLQKLLYIEQQTKKMFIFDLISFALIFTAFWFGNYQSILSVAIVRAIIEIATTLIFINKTIISTTGKNNFYTLIKTSIPIVISYASSAFLLLYLNFEASALTTLFINTTLVLLCSFISIIFMYHLWFKKYAEWQYLFNLCSRVLKKNKQLL